MNDSDPTRKTAGESLYSLRCEHYLRHQHDAAFAARDNCRQRLQIHLCLAASGDAMQQNRLDVFLPASLLKCQEVQNMLQCTLLCRRERQWRTGGENRAPESNSTPPF